jgi:Phage tail assembly chaperone protein
MEIRIRATGQVMYESELRSYLQANDGPSYDQLTPEVMEAIGVDPVLESPQASPTRYQVAFRDGVQEIDGQWFTKYSVADMGDEAKAAKDAEQAKSVRDQRNTKLSECDWTQVADAPVDKATWATYRQALRDISSQAGFPWDITWPDAP